MKANAVLLLVALGFSVAVTGVARADPPADAKKVLAELDKDVKAIEAKARKELLERQEKAVKQLEELQAAYAKAGKKDDAAAVGGAVKQLKEENAILAVGASVLPDPGNLGGYRGKDNEVFYFRVVGSTDGQVWGSDVYTDDSHLATAAVHAGLVKSGESGIVKVTILPGQGSYTGSTANEVTTEGWDQWDGSFKLEAVKAEKK
jgi:LCCL domain